MKRIHFGRDTRLPPSPPPPPPGRVVRDGFLPRVAAGRPYTPKLEQEKPADAVEFMDAVVMFLGGIGALAFVVALAFILLNMERIG